MGELLRHQLDDGKEDRDRWRAQAERLAPRGPEPEKPPELQTPWGGCACARPADCRRHRRPLLTRDISSIHRKKSEEERVPMELTTLEQHAMLAIMALRQTAYGISIQEHIRQQAGYEPSVGSIYAALDRLEEKGFVRSKQGEATPERGGRRKLYFSLTAPGEKALREALRAVGSLSRAAGWKEALAS
jgi:PadR family transcriptional regulator PadR